MLKKVILGTLFIGLIAVLVIGAINRTVDKREDTSLAAGQGWGQNQSTQEIKSNRQEPNFQRAGGQGYGGGRAAANNTGQYPNYQEAIDEWLSYDGVVTRVPAAGVDLVLETDDGQLVVGIGPLSLSDLGLEVQIGDALEIRGYWEDDELKAAEIIQLATGQTVTLRDGWGRPVWSGSGQGGRGIQDDRLEAGGQGQGAVDTTRQRAGRGGNDERGGEANDQVTPGIGQAQVGEWFTLQGTVSDVDQSAMVIQLSSGESVTLQGRPWRFVQEQGFSAAVGDEITMLGFYEDEDFEAGQLANITTGLVIQIRGENGRPLWAGSGRRS